MGQKEIAKLVMVGGAAGLISILIAGALFKSGQQPTTVPVVQSISADFPDVNNDPIYGELEDSFMCDVERNTQIRIHYGNIYSTSTRVSNL